MVLLKSCWHITCVRRHESLHKKTSQSRIIGYTYAGETHFLSYRRSTLAQSSKYSQKNCGPITLSPSVTLFRSRIDRISKRIFSTTNYFNQQWLSLSSSYWRSQKTSLGIINIRSKKKYYVQKYVLYYTISKHICLEQFSIRFGWIWLDAHACMWHRNLYKYSITNQGQQKQFSSSTVSKYARYESSSGKMLLTFSLVSTPCLYWDSGKTEDKIWR